MRDDGRYPKRKPTRLKEYDYSRPNAYYITICTYQRKPILGTIIPGNETSPVVCVLSDYGRIAEWELKDLERRFQQMTLERYVIMPNHIHVLFSLQESDGANARKDISAIFGAFKSLTTRKCRQIGLVQQHLFQGSFYDEVIRNEAHYQNCWRYIEENPTKWALDEYYGEY